MTVLMPVYNSPDIYVSVNSVISQTYNPIQFILIDDHSQDFSAQEMNAYLEAHAKRNLQSWTVLENEKNLGTVKTLNKGIVLSQGDIIFNLAGDDMFYDEFVLQDWVRAFQTSGACVMTGVRENYDHELLKQLGITPSERQAQLLKAQSPDKLFEQLVLDNFVSGCCTARTKAFFQEYGLYDERYRLIEDFPANLRLLRAGGKIEFFDRKVIKYRGGGASSGGTANPEYEHDIRTIFEYEIFPYTAFRKRAQSVLRHREKDIAFDQTYAVLAKQHENSLVMRMLLRCWYYIHHPVQAVRKITKYN